MKKIIAMLFILLLAFALTACSLSDMTSFIPDQNLADTSETETTDETDSVLEIAKSYIDADEPDYLSAIRVLQDAIAAGQDDQEGQLQSALEKYQKKYASQIENEVSELIGNEEYESAKQTLSDAEEYLAGIETFEDTKVWAEAMIAAKIAYADGDYETAMSLLKDADAELGGNSELESAIEACKSGYIDYLTEQINAYVMEGTETALNSADTLLAAAEELIPGDTTVTELKSTVTKAWQKLTTYTAAKAEFLTYSDSITTEDQVNSYTITPAVSGTYRIDFSGMVNGFEIKCYVYDSLGEKVGGTSGYLDSSTGNGDGVTVSLTAGETYEIEVKQWDDTGEYTMTIGQKKAIVTIDTYSAIYDTIEFKDQNIGYKFTPTVTGYYRFDFSEMVNGFKITLNVYNSLNEKQTGDNSSSIGNEEGATYYLTAGETYTLNVVYKTGMGSYIMNIGKQNETRTLSGNSSISDEITFEGQKNYYEFTADTTGTYQFSVTGMNSDFEIEASVYDDLGYEVVGDSLQNESFTAELTAGDIYKIVVSQDNGTGSYVLSVN